MTIGMWETVNDLVYRLVVREGVKMAATPCDRAGNPIEPYIEPTRAPYRQRWPRSEDVWNHPGVEGQVRLGHGPDTPYYLEVEAAVAAEAKVMRDPATLPWALPNTPEMVAAAERRIVALEAVVVDLIRHLAAANSYADEMMRIADQEGDDPGSTTAPIDPHDLLQRAAKEILGGNTAKSDRDDVQGALDKAPRDKPSFPVNPAQRDHRRIGG